LTLGYSAEEMALGRQYKDATRREELLEDIQAAIEFLQDQPQVNGEKGVGAMGFCFGGHVAYFAATLPKIAATACFYGAGIPVFSPGGGVPTLARTSEMHGEVIWDVLIPHAHIEAIEAALLAAGVPHQVIVYPEAGHGFMCDARADYCPQEAQQSWGQLIEFFNRTLVNRPVSPSH
jgi:carboxymethylenebutenolidase